MTSAGHLHTCTGKARARRRDLVPAGDFGPAAASLAGYPNPDSRYLIREYRHPNPDSCYPIPETRFTSPHSRTGRGSSSAKWTGPANHLRVMHV